MLVVVTNFNRLTWTKNLVNQILELDDANPVIVDNASTYPPLLDWYDNRCPVSVVRLHENLGPYAVWKKGLGLELGDRDYVAVTDNDLDLTGVPKDALQHLTKGLERYQVGKCGLSLEFRDLPAKGPFTPKISKDQMKRWAWRTCCGQFFWEPVWSTFAVYPGRSFQIDKVAAGPCLRSDRPYTARHLPWYLTSDNVTEEDHYYFESVPDDINIGWGNNLARRLFDELHQR